MQNYDGASDRRIAFYFEVFQFVTLQHFECSFDVDSQLYKVAIQRTALKKTWRKSTTSRPRATRSSR